jgi:hypothetical protein
MMVRLLGSNAPYAIRDRTGTVERSRIASLELQVGTTTFADITSLVTTDGSFRLDRATLERLTGQKLVDGEQTMTLQAKNAAGQVISTQALTFTLDTVGPSLSVSSLADGVFWTNQETLSGKVSNFDAGSSLSYYLDGNAANALYLTPNANGDFTSPTLVLPQDSNLHRLVVKVQDKAGNKQTLAYDFINGELPPATDNDVLDEDVVPFPPLPLGIPVNNPVTNPITGEMGSTLQDWVRGWTGGWGVGGSGSGWGYSVGGGGGGDNPPPRLILPPTNDPTIPPPDYMEKMGIILAQAALSLPSGTPKEQNRKAAFINRASVLMEVSRRVEQTWAYSFMLPESTLYQVYNQGFWFDTRAQALQEGITLANDLSGSTDAIKVEVLKNELLITAYTGLLNGYLQVPHEFFLPQEWSTEMGKLARIYAALDPQSRVVTRFSTTPDFLAPLWKAQQPVNQRPQTKAVIQENLDLSAAAFKALATDHPDPLGAVRIATNLLKTASNVAYLREDLKDAAFVRELVGFAFQQAKQNHHAYQGWGRFPIFGEQMPESVYGEQLGTALYQFGDPAFDDTSRQAQMALGQAFKSLTSTEQKLKLLRLVGNLMEAVHQVPALKEQPYVSISDFLENHGRTMDALIPLATAYLALNPTGSAAEGQPLKFLETLAQPRTPETISQGAAELQALLGGASTYAERRKLLEMEIKLLQAAKQVQLTSDRPELSQQMSDVTFINALAAAGRAYNAFHFLPDQPGDVPFNSFLDTLHRAQTPAEIKLGSTQLDAFLRDPSNPGRPMFGMSEEAALGRVKLMDFTTNLLKAARQTPHLRFPSSPRLKELMELGRAYASLDTTLEATNPDPKLFLNTLWQTQDVQKGSAELQTFLDDNAKAPLPELFEFEQKLLISLKMMPDPDLQAKVKDVSFLNDMLDWGAKYVASKYDEDLVVNDLDGFFPLVAQGKYNQGAIVASKELKNVVPDVIKGIINYIYLSPLVNASVPTSIYNPDGKEKALALHYLPSIIQAYYAAGGSDYAEIAYIIATAALESKWGRDYFDTGLEGRLVEKVEKRGIVAGSEDEIRDFKVYDGLYGNIPDNNGKPDPTDDYYVYRGRGFAQLTFRGIYKQISQAIWGNNVLENSPEEAEKPAIAARILVEGMLRGLFVPNNPPLNSYINSKRRMFDWANARDIVNPNEGKETTSNRHKIAELAKIYYSLLTSKK